MTESRKKEKNYIFTGDLNAFPGSFLLNELNGLSNIKNVGPDDSEKTWTTKPFEKQGFIENDLNWRLDYVFTTSDIMVNSSEVVDTEFSDHLPILAHLII
jgi:endonuclease/exonuclease/phosphatase (EEP) superfamily protein YafD